MKTKDFNPCQRKALYKNYLLLLLFNLMTPHDTLTRDDDDDDDDDDVGLNVLGYQEQTVTYPVLKNGAL